MNLYIRISEILNTNISNRVFGTLYPFEFEQWISIVEIKVLKDCNMISDYEHILLNGCFEIKKRCFSLQHYYFPSFISS